MLTFDQLEEDVLPFYAYIVNGEADMYLRVKLRNSQTPANGTFLTAEGRNYQAKLARQENNFITLYIKQGAKPCWRPPMQFAMWRRWLTGNTPA
ncbi:MAG: hypothetical protein ACLU9S_23030 [Oscillospiraceae bacterium]